MSLKNSFFFPFVHLLGFFNPFNIYHSPQESDLWVHVWLESNLIDVDPWWNNNGYEVSEGWWCSYCSPKLWNPPVCWKKFIKGGGGVRWAATVHQCNLWSALLHSQYRDKKKKSSSEIWLIAVSPPLNPNIGENGGWLTGQIHQPHELRAPGKQRHFLSCNRISTYSEVWKSENCIVFIWP